MVNISKYPSLRDVEIASRFAVCAWHRVLRSRETDAEREIDDRIEERYADLGGPPPHLSQKIGS